MTTRKDKSSWWNKILKSPEEEVASPLQESPVEEKQDKRINNLLERLAEVRRSNRELGTKLESAQTELQSNSAVVSGPKAEKLPQQSVTEPQQIPSVPSASANSGEVLRTVSVSSEMPALRAEGPPTETGTFPSIRDRFPGLSGVKREEEQKDAKSPRRAATLPRMKAVSRPSLGSISFRGPEPGEFSQESVKQLLDSIEKLREEKRRLSKEKKELGLQLLKMERRFEQQDQHFQAQALVLENKLLAAKNEFYKERTKLHQLQFKLEAQKQESFSTNEERILRELDWEAEKNFLQDKLSFLVQELRCARERNEEALLNQVVEERQAGSFKESFFANSGHEQALSDTSSHLETIKTSHAAADSFQDMDAVPFFEHASPSHSKKN